MGKIIGILCFAVALAMTFTSFPQGAVAVLLASVLVVIVIFIIRQNEVDRDFLIEIFLAALLVRLIFGLLVHIFDLRVFFGGDALTYDKFGRQMVEYWFGQNPANDTQLLGMVNTRMPGWGMFYLVSIIYTIVGSNILAAQAFCGVIGAATAPMVYVCAYRMFHNRRVSRIAALISCFFSRLYHLVIAIIKRRADNFSACVGNDDGYSVAKTV